MGNIVRKWGRNDEKDWIGNLKDQSLSMQISNNLFPIWARALMHDQNPEVTVNNPPNTKQFVWIKKHTPLLTELKSKGKEPEKTEDNKPSRSPSPLPNLPLAAGPRGPSPLPDIPPGVLAKYPTPLPTAPGSDVEVVQRRNKTADTSYESPISLESSQARSKIGSPSCKYARSPTGELIGDVIRHLRVHISHQSLRSGSNLRQVDLSPLKRQE
jgi:hypothetical protein